MTELQLADIHFCARNTKKNKNQIAGNKMQLVFWNVKIDWLTNVFPEKKIDCYGGIELL